MKHLLQKVRRRKFIFSLVYISCFFLLIRILHFAFPAESKVFQSVILAQFFISFAGFLYSVKVGRIVTVVGAISAVRMESLAFSSPGLVTNAGIFAGASAGILFRYLFFEKKSSPAESLKYSFTSAQLYGSLIFFLSVLLLDRFIVLFNAPFFRGMGIQETMYFPSLSSHSAFSISAGLGLGLIFPLLYFMQEESNITDRKSGAELSAHFRAGLWVALLFNAPVILIQTYFNVNFLASGTNNAYQYERVTGLFRDAGSASWIFPVLILFFYWHLAFYGRKFQRTSRIFSGVKKENFIFILSFAVLIILLVFGIRQGRAYWLISGAGYPVITYLIYRKRNKKIILALALFCAVSLPAVLTLPTMSRLRNSLNSVLSSGSLIKAAEAADSERFFLNRAALEVFYDSPVFGNGLSSLIPNLFNPDFPIRHPSGIIDNPGMILTGVLSDTGLLGLLTLLIWISMHSYSRKRFAGLVFLLIPSLTGYQAVHPDGAFLYLMLIGPVYKICRYNRYIVFSGSVFIFLIGACYAGNIFFRVNHQNWGPEFRLNHILSYQLFPFQMNLAAEKNRLLPERKDLPPSVSFHHFKGKLIWKLGRKEKIVPYVFLSDGTRKNILQQKWTFLDKQENEIISHRLILEKWKIRGEELKVPVQAVYVQVEELDSEGRILMYGDTVFAVLSIQFTKLNEVE